MPTRTITRVWTATAALVAAVAVWVAATLPPPRLALERRGDDGTVSGVIHIHTSRSDGRGSPEEIAGAAARAGLQFVVFTDHGDATRPMDAPVYRSGVLCIDAVEISTTGGHYLAIGLPKAPYPLGGEPRDVVEDVARLGGFGIAAHPDSPKPELAWRDWEAPIDGIEIVNPDSGWRRRAQEAGLRPRLSLIARLFAYPFRPAETIASFMTEPRGNLARWDTLTRARKIVGLAGADAHSRLALGSSEPGDGRMALPLPGYEASFRALSVHVQPRAPLGGEAASDARSIIDGIRAGHLYIAVEGIAAPPVFSFTASTGTERGGEGDEVGGAGPLTIRVRSNAPAGFATTVWRGSRVLKVGDGGELSAIVDSAPAVYRAEVRASTGAGDRVWIISNPIYVREHGSAGSPASVPAADAPQPAPSTAISTLPIFDGNNANDWNVEHDPTSTGAVEGTLVGGEGALHLRYTLGSTAASHPSVALLRDLSDGVYGHTGLSFTASADRPMRVSVQLRTGATTGPQQRWQRSVYLDTSDRVVALRFEDFTPVGDAPPGRPVLDKVHYVMFVVEGTNTAPGASGDVWVRRVNLSTFGR